MSEMTAEIFKRNILKMMIALTILFTFFYILTPFIVPVVLGGILAMAFSPFLGFFTKRGWSRKISLVTITASFFLIGMAPIGLVLMRGTNVVTHFLSEQSLVARKDKVELKIYTYLDHFSEKSNIDPEVIREKFESAMNNIGKYALNLFSSFLSQIPDLMMLSLIMILSFYFFLLEEEKIRRWFDRYFYFSKKHGDHFITLVKSSCKEVFFSNVFTGIAQASIIAGGAYFCQIGDFFIVFVITFFLSFIPTGAGPVGFVLSVLAFLDSRFGAGFAMACVAGFSGIIDNFLRPYLNSRGNVKVPAFVNFLAIIGGVLMIGLAGLFVGPLLASLAYGALPIILEEWFPEVATDGKNDK
ncbi:MAG: AI-2E family transporter [Bacteriovorax sp.]|nr:AI-2E family transporter [Bacteriovorax sp.]